MNPNPNRVTTSTLIELALENRLLAIIQSRIQNKDNIWDLSSVVQDLINKGLELEKKSTSKPQEEILQLHEQATSNLRQQVDLLTDKVHDCEKTIATLTKMIETNENESCERSRRFEKDFKHLLDLVRAILIEMPNH